MAPRGHRGAIALLSGGSGGLEFYGDAAIDRRFRTGIVAHAGRHVADSTVLMVDAELVLPIAVGNPDVDEVAVLISPHGFGGVERQTDRLRVELDRGLGAGKRIVLISLFTIPGETAADRPELHAFGQEAEIHVVVGFDRPGRIEAAVAVHETVDAGDVAGKAGAALGEGVAVG